MSFRNRPVLLLTTASLFAALAGCSGGDSPAADGTDSTAAPTSWSRDVIFFDCDGPTVDPAGCLGEGETGTYNSLEPAEVTQAWQLCATVPHVKDPIWVGANYAIIKEAERLNVNLDFTDAGGYTEVVTQVEQMENCVARGADAIILGSVSTDALNPAIEEAIAADVVVIDAGNGVTTPEISAHSSVDYIDMGKAVGDYLVAKNEPVNVALLPGPAGAGWAERSVVGFREAIAGSQVTIVDTLYGDTGREVQLGLVEDALTAHPDLDAIVGTAVTLDVAATVVAERDLRDQVDLYGTYMNRETLALVEGGRAVCAPTDQSITTFQMAVDLAVRALEDKPVREGFDKDRVSDIPFLVCGPSAGDANNTADFDTSTSFGPEDWSVVTSVKAK